MSTPLDTPPTSDSQRPDPSPDEGSGTYETPDTPADHKPDAESHFPPPYSSPTDAPLPQDLFGLMYDMLRQLPEMLRPQVTQYIYGGSFGAANQTGTQTVQMHNASPQPQNTATTPPDASPMPLFDSVSAVETWFFSLRDDEPLTFEMRLHVLVMAVFSGNSLRFIESAKTILRDQITMGRTAPKPDASVFARSISAVLHATATQAATVPQHDGLTQVYRFRETHYQIMVLQFLSTAPDLYVFRQAFQAWLRTICTQSDATLYQLGASLTTMTRIQAAIGLGEFAKQDFSYYDSTLIQPWAETWFADDHTLNHVTVLGWVLFQLATDSRYTDQVYQRVMTWASTTSAGETRTLKELSLIWTATQMISMLGLLNMERTLPIITQLAAQRIPDQPLFLLFPLVSLYSAAWHANSLLDLFTDWQRLPRDNPTHVHRATLGLRYFLFLVGGKTQTDSRMSLTSREPEPSLAVPTDAQAMAERLLRRVGNADELIQATIWDVIQRGRQTGTPHPEASLEYLIKCVLRQNGSVVDHMIDLLGQWLRLADQRADVRDSILLMMRRIKRDPAGNRIIDKLCKGRAFTTSTAARFLLQD